MNANNSLKVLFENIFKLNTSNYVDLIEHDLFEIMQHKQINQIFSFLQISNKEEMIEQDSGELQLFCNFEQQLKSDKLPATWFKEDHK